MTHQICITAKFVIIDKLVIRDNIDNTGDIGDKETVLAHLYIGCASALILIVSNHW